MIKKLMTSALALSMLIASAAAPQRAEAFIGFVTGNAPLIIVGAVAAAVDSAFVVSCVNGPHFRHCREGFAIGSVGVIGLLLLDGERGQSAAFSPMTSAGAQKLGLSAAQQSAYNQELAEINAIRQDLLSDVLVRTDGGEAVSGAEIHQQWLQAREAGMISPAAFEALEKVSAQVGERASQR